MSELSLTDDQMAALRKVLCWSGFARNATNTTTDDLRKALGDDD